MMKIYIVQPSCDGYDALFTHGGGSKPPPYAVWDTPLSPENITVFYTYTCSTQNVFLSSDTTIFVPPMRPRVW